MCSLIGLAKEGRIGEVSRLLPPDDTNGPTGNDPLSFLVGRHVRQ